MEIIEKKIENITPYEKNPRKNDEAVDAVANSIKEFGFKVPIVIDKDGIIVAGHTRYKAAKKLRMKSVPCIVASDLTDEQIKAFRLADNRTAELAEWDMELLTEELDEILNIDMSEFGFEAEEEQQTEAVEDDYEPDMSQEARSKKGDIYILGNHRLMCGSSTDEKDVQKLLNGEQMDLCVTDPPYNVALGKHMKPSESKQRHRQTGGELILNDDMSNDEFVEFLKSAFQNMIDSLKPGGCFYIFYADNKGLEFRQALKDTNIELRQNLIWVKNTFSMGRQDYQWRHEPCLYGWKEGAAHYFVDDRTQSTVFEDLKDIEKMTKQELVDYIKAQEEATPTTIIREKKPTASDLHPTMKPLKLVGKLISNSSRKDEKVLDLFGGSGSTLIACEQLDRKCYMMELDPLYVDVILDRWEKFTGEKAVKEE